LTNEETLSKEARSADAFIFSRFGINSDNLAGQMVLEGRGVIKNQKERFLEIMAMETACRNDDSTIICQLS